MKRVLVVLLVLGALAGLLVIGGLWGLGYYLSPQNKLVRSDVIVAISGGETAARTEEAVKLYQEGWAPHIIFSGAALDPNSPSNAAAMAAAARKAGVPAEAIALDEAAANTRQNAAGVAAIVNRQGYKSVILVTSPYHQRRAYVTFHRALGPALTITNHSSFDENWRRSHWWATPYSRNLTFSELQKVLFELASDAKQ